MKTSLKVTAILIALAGSGFFAVPGEGTEAEADTRRLLFVAYPDGSNWLMADMLDRLAAAYEKQKPEVSVELRPRTGYEEARTAVIRGKAVGMMISEEINKLRASVITRQEGRAFGRGYARELKLNRFIPIAVRTIHDQQDELAAKMRFGIATDRVSEDLEKFLAFLATEAAEEALADIPDTQPATPADEPASVTEIRSTQGFPWKEPLALPAPILTY